MAQRADLKAELEKLGVKLYYNPPESIKMDYPCIVYNLDNMDSSFANNSKYLTNKSYELKYITFDVDDPMVDTIYNLPYCKFDRPYNADDLHHFVFTITI